MWLLGKRKGTYYADGRGNQPRLGRYSLGARDHATAMTNLAELDHVKAIEVGLADPEAADDPNGVLSLTDGWQMYEDHYKRPIVLGGTRVSTQKCYKNVEKKFRAYAEVKGITCWQQVTKRVLEKYAVWLTEEGLAHVTQTFHLTILMQVNKYLVEEGHLPENGRVKLQLERERDSTRYCWTTPQVQAMLDWCRSQPELNWLHDILLTLSMTGMRISELLQLRWSDIRFSPVPIVNLVDESRKKASVNGSRRTLKSGCSRSFPMHPQLVLVLQGLPRHRDGYVFHAVNGEPLAYHHLRQTFIEKVMTPLKDRFPTPEGEQGFQHGCFHSFRHYFCSQCANSAVPERMLMAWLGHSDSAMIRRYYHLDIQESQRQMDRVSIPVVNGDDNAAAILEEKETTAPPPSGNPMNR